MTIDSNYLVLWGHGGVVHRRGRDETLAAVALRTVAAAVTLQVTIYLLVED